jgi:ATP-dependent RNA helicase DDX56/DBP9
MSDLLAPTTFADLAHLLDARLLRALADFKFLHPTLVQAKAIPLALAGKDILAKARTGSGKTGAYCIPVVQKVLSVKSVRPPLPSAGTPTSPSRRPQFIRTDASASNLFPLAGQSLELSDPDRQQTRALILVPTRELAEQVTRTLKGLVTYCDKEVLVANVAGGASAQLQRSVSCSQTAPLL